MPGSFKKEDLRIKKTYKALLSAMLIVLQNKNFNQLTVNDMCEEALISRATFYVHFNDKYDLLKFWLSNFQNEIINVVFDYDELVLIVNQFISEHQKVLTNILIEANSETLELINNFISVIIDVAIKEYNVVDKSQRTILTNFCTGGLVNILLLHVKRNYPSDEDVLSPYLYETLTCILKREYRNK